MTRLLRLPRRLRAALAERCGRSLGRLLSCVALGAAAAWVTTAAAAPGPVFKTDQVKAELVAHAPQGVAPGKPVWLGLRIDHAPHWHTYWKNPGDSGLPTTMEWTLPAGFAAGEIAWPTPKKLPVGPLMNYGYEGTLLLAVPLTVPAGFAGDVLPVKLQAQWLVCKDVCIPEQGEFALDLPAKAVTALHAALFDAAQAAVPAPAAGARARAQVRGAALEVSVSGLPADWQGRDIALFPELAGVIDNAAKVSARWSGAEWSAKVPLSPQRSESPAQMAVVLVRDGVTAGLRAEVSVAGPWPAPGAPPEVAAHGSTASAASAGAGSPLGLAAALGLALLGGMLLNLMPCVFPVLSLKVMGFASHAHDRRTLLAGGVAYTGGVVVSFMALAGLLLALRAGGEQLGWGFQLQSPVFVAGLALLFTLIGLNLAGVFEFGSVLPSSLAAMRARHPMADSALTGVLAVAVASPCTAPFMGASLGLAVTLPAHEALAVFAALGLGMAAPYLAASAWPALAQRLPRPGVWMAHLRTAMAFPMFATVVWLAWVLGQQAGIDAVAGLLGTLLALGFAAWVFGAQSLGHTGRRALGALAVALLAATLAWAWPALKPLPESASVAPASTERWQPWSPERVREALAQGRPVFVDFTAAWCVTCQFNKRTVLSDPAVLADFDARRVLLLRADWTRRDPQIGAELARLQRSGVPVYALMAPGDAGPRLLSEILTVREVRDALAALR